MPQCLRLFLTVNDAQVRARNDGQCLRHRRQPHTHTDQVYASAVLLRANEPTASSRVDIIAAAERGSASPCKSSYLASWSVSPRVPPLPHGWKASARARQWPKHGSNRTISCAPVTTVVDASALVAGPVESGNKGRWAEATFAAGELAGQELVLVEARNILRRLEQGEKKPRIEATSAHRMLLRLDIQLFPFAPFAERIRTLSSTLTSYDAWYVALAEALDGPLAPLDRKLSRTGGPNCENIAPPSPDR